MHEAWGGGEVGVLVTHFCAVAERVRGEKRCEKMVEPVESVGSCCLHGPVTRLGFDFVSEHRTWFLHFLSLKLGPHTPTCCHQERVWWAVWLALCIGWGGGDCRIAYVKE